MIWGYTSCVRETGRKLAIHAFERFAAQADVPKVDASNMGVSKIEVLISTPEYCKSSL